MKKLFLVLFVCSALVLMGCQTTGNAINIGEGAYFGQEVALAPQVSGECQELLEMSRLPEAQEDEGLRHDLVRQAIDRRCCLAEFEEMALLHPDAGLLEEFAQVCTQQAQEQQVMLQDDTPSLYDDSAYVIGQNVEDNSFVNEEVESPSEPQEPANNQNVVSSITDLSCPSSAFYKKLSVGDEFSLDGKYKLLYEGADSNSKIVYIATADFSQMKQYSSQRLTGNVYGFVLNEKDFNPNVANPKTYLLVNATSTAQSYWDLEFTCRERCVDTDGGKDYFTKGGAGFLTGVGRDDLCSGNDLQEAYCETPLSYTTESFDCTSKGMVCSSGACVTPPVKDIMCGDQIYKGAKFKLGSTEVVYNGLKKTSSGVESTFYIPSSGETQLRNVDIKKVGVSPEFSQSYIANLKIGGNSYYFVNMTADGSVMKRHCQTCQQINKGTTVAMQLPNRAAHQVTVKDVFNYSYGNAAVVNITSSTVTFEREITAGRSSSYKSNPYEYVYVTQAIKQDYAGGIHNADVCLSNHWHLR